MASQHFGARGRGNRMAPERLVVEAGAVAGGEIAGDGGGRDQVARGLETEIGDGLLDRGHFHLQAVQRGIGQAQRLGGERLVVRDFFGQHRDVDIFLVDAVEQLHHHRRQRRQVVQRAHHVVVADGITHARAPAARCGNRAQSAAAGWWPSRCPRRGRFCGTGGRCAPRGGRGWPVPAPARPVPIAGPAPAASRCHGAASRLAWPRSAPCLAAAEPVPGRRAARPTGPCRAVHWPGPVDDSCLSWCLPSCWLTDITTENLPTAGRSIDVWDSRPPDTAVCRDCDAGARHFRHVCATQPVAAARSGQPALAPGGAGALTDQLAIGVVGSRQGQGRQYRGCRDDAARAGVDPRVRHVGGPVLGQAAARRRHPGRHRKRRGGGRHARRGRPGLPRFGRFGRRAQAGDRGPGGGQLQPRPDRSHAGRRGTAQGHRGVAAGPDPGGGAGAVAAHRVSPAQAPARRLVRPGHPQQRRGGRVARQPARRAGRSDPRFQRHPAQGQIEYPAHPRGRGRSPPGGPGHGPGARRAAPRAGIAAAGRAAGLAGRPGGRRRPRNQYAGGHRAHQRVGADGGHRQGAASGGGRQRQEVGHHALPGDGRRKHAPDHEQRLPRCPPDPQLQADRGGPGERGAAPLRAARLHQRGRLEPAAQAQENPHHGQHRLSARPHARQLSGRTGPGDHEPHAQLRGARVRAGRGGPHQYRGGAPGRLGGDAGERQRQGHCPGHDRQGVRPVRHHAARPGRHRPGPEHRVQFAGQAVCRHHHGGQRAGSGRLLHPAHAVRDARRRPPVSRIPDDAGRYWRTKAGTKKIPHRAGCSGCGARLAVEAVETFGDAAARGDAQYDQPQHQHQRRFQFRHRQRCFVDLGCGPGGGAGDGRVGAVARRGPPPAGRLAAPAGGGRLAPGHRDGAVRPRKPGPARQGAKRVPGRPVRDPGGQRSPLGLAIVLPGHPAGAHIPLALGGRQPVAQRRVARGARRDPGHVRSAKHQGLPPGPAAAGSVARRPAAGNRRGSLRHAARDDVQRDGRRPGVARHLDGQDHPRTAAARRGAHRRQWPRAQGYRSCARSAGAGVSRPRSRHPLQGRRRSRPRAGPLVPRQAVAHVYLHARRAGSGARGAAAGGCRDCGRTAADRSAGLSSGSRTAACRCGAVRGAALDVPDRQRRGCAATGAAPGVAPYAAPGAAPCVAPGAAPCVVPGAAPCAAPSIGACILSAWHPAKGDQQAGYRPVRQLDRHHDRILRFLHLRHRRRAGVPQAVLPSCRSCRRHAAIAGHVCHRLLCPPHRLGRVRPLRRPYRPQGHAGGGAAHHGHLHGRDRLAAHVRHHRHLGAGLAGAVSLRPGPGPGRRVGRGHPAGHGKCAAGQARLVRHVPAAGRADRLFPVGRHFPAAHRSADRRRILQLRLAHPVPGQRLAGDRGAVRAPENPRNAGLPESARQERARQSAGGDRLPRARPGAGAGHADRAGHLRAVLPDDGVCAELGHHRAACFAQGFPDPATVCGDLLRSDHSGGRRVGRPLWPRPHADLGVGRHCRVRPGAGAAVRLGQQHPGDDFPVGGAGADGADLRSARYHVVRTVSGRGALHGVVAHLQPGRHPGRLAGAVHRHVAGHPLRFAVRRLLPDGRGLGQPGGAAAGAQAQPIVNFAQRIDRLVAAFEQPLVFACLASFMVVR
uniref:Uncharacterized protein n=1 Tax=Tanacetum cinerariifolium TaxID=118510 RepID=A0A699GDT1_TANCI|nr:hypothetical protein [Tanacetum cinerariifolium]